jgi:hypothetical protein
MALSPTIAPYRDPYSSGFTPDQLALEAGVSNFHPSITAALKWLADDGHLPINLKEINNIFGHVAIIIAMASPQSPQTTIAIHKLVEAKDAAIRGHLDGRP